MTRHDTATEAADTTGAPCDITVTVDRLVTNGLKALTDYEAFTQEQIDHIVKKASVAALDRHTALARLAVEETGRGVFEDKAAKNMFACEHVTHSMGPMKTVGVIARDDIEDMIEVAEPVGVICAITPVTNPTSTTVFKALMALKTRNPVVFAFHPSAQKCSTEAARIVRDAAVAAGAPEHCVQWIETPSVQATEILMHHPGVSLILATGGNAMVRAAYSAGKPALGVGAGNVPAYVHRSAKLRRAVNDLVLSKSFDNGMICASEQAVILDAEIYDAALAEFRVLGAHLATAEEKEKLERFLFPAGAAGGGCEPKVNPAAVGQSSAWIAEQAGFTVPDDTSLILVEADRVGPDEPLTREKLCPVLAVLRAGSEQQGFSLAADMVAFHGQGHSAVIHTEDPDLAEAYGRSMKTVRIIVNAPSSQGAIGGIYNHLLPSLTLGCGSWGHTSVSNNVSAAQLLNVKRVSARRNNLQWFKVPPKIYFEPQAIRYLASMPDVHRVTIVTDATMTRLGFVDRVTRVLQRRREPVTIQVIDGVEPEPSIGSVQRGAKLMSGFRPDTIIALGGGSPMDAAKVMWLLYEHPDVDFADMRHKFSDIRKRAFRFPVLGSRARLVCVPTTSGTGAEVTPFAVISDPATGKKYPLADYALTPSVAIVDPLLTADLPSALAADSGFDALTHAIEAYVSVYANDFTDGLALHAIRLIFDNIEAAVNDRADRPEAREKIHNAATIAGMAFGNAFLGIVHAMAHTLGATFHIAHGRTNAVLLPHVIRYNGTVPTKLTAWPKYENYRAPERFQEIAGVLGLPASTPHEGVESLALAVERLRDAVGIEASFQALGVEERAFLDALPQQALNAYEDQCAPANPRMPMLDDMQKLMRAAYYSGAQDVRDADQGRTALA
ncbi:bifunctional acetaldehyde-CoA/alcohol dehydrogenase [Streptomyces pluripotens]|uniref:Aldehyde-alcohol dehydrogenase n=1 Tax=Streptomyces pluripotens TaxID=1355015 RepID=A0A221P678_9ACTN|nr:MULTISPECIES: bifunctional acetaldehyde-CoA/alcohol dehydrogenase [Streptomyces]ARP73376.1 bifunctional acetaldehyde-CoA/alcohol dehydrogenase [Streptomyces pluripotens]ASN27624.1 bifunctional acetaldehyde-CoA/alcohol dehydrogenase [Streptomyces pluripotens]KIE28544.1 acetaldehyde dehydrogenase [Streptomyces sp. MUSC 125]MCH0560304.1 bifunctional acetaldehyde-CoA/alcohol dehydrogenase [Streptomyces sp. MUM 16J]